MERVEYRPRWRLNEKFFPPGIFILVKVGKEV
jgi:hypothetical protein